MANAGTGFDDGEGSVFADKLNKIGTPPGNKEVHIIPGVEQSGGGFPFSGQQGAERCVQLVLFQHRMDQSHNGLVGRMGVLAALQDGGIARLEAKGKHVEADVWPGFVDDADDAEAHTDFAEVQAVGPGRFSQHASQWGGQFSHVPKVGGDVGQALFSQSKPVVFWIGRIHAVQVFPVLGQQHGGVGQGSGGQVVQHGFQGGVADQRQQPAGGAGLLKGLGQVHVNRGINNRNESAAFRPCGQQPPWRCCSRIGPCQRRFGGLPGRRCQQCRLFRRCRRCG